MSRGDVVSFPRLYKRILRVSLSLAVVAAAGMTAMSSVAVAAPPQIPSDSVPVSGSCRDVTLPVSLTDNGPRTETLWAQLCEPFGGPAKAVQVLVHGAVYSHVYWDFPYQPEKYSYVRRANAAGYATLNIDRIGIRNSSHPPAASVTLQSNAAVVHQAITALRAGALGTTFEKVVTVGHSYGTLTTMLEAEVYDDIDAFMPTGILHPLTQKGAVILFPNLRPAQLEGPRFAGYPAGYLTTAPGIRDDLFLYPPNTVAPEFWDPAIEKVDESLKETFTLGEIATIPVSLPGTLAIDVPTLSVVGQKDAFVCSLPTDCSQPVSVANAEGLFWNASCFQLELIPNTGHNLTQQTNAPKTAEMMQDWLDRALSGEVLPGCPRDRAGAAT
jgi:pimeloyl-ACP methyl ester carboxylesterase